MITTGPETAATKDRLRGAIWGQFVGDAAALGSHWIYDLEELRRRFPGGVNGFEAPASDHYHVGKFPGDQTHYGDGALVLLESVAQVGHFDLQTFGRRFLNAFEPGVYRGYLDYATKETISLYRAFTKTHRAEEFDFQQGADDDQLATASRLAVVVVRHRSERDLLRRVEALTRVCQNNARSVAYMKASAWLHLTLLDGLDPQEAVHTVQRGIAEVEPTAGTEVREKCRAALTALDRDVTSATLAFGQSCPLEHSFPAALHALLKHPDDFASGILATLRAGGDSAGRAALLGGWLGARLGYERIPESWRARLTQADRIAAATEKVLNNCDP